MLKVYFTAATSFDGDMRRHYEKIISLINNFRIKLLSGEQIVNEKLLLNDKNLTQTQIFERERKSIEHSDCVIAEVTKPSLGVGSEITYALNKNKQVLALVLEGYANKISPIIAGNPSENLFLEFYNFDRLPYKLSDFLSYVKGAKKRAGKLIVIDGGNASGKTLQGKLIVDYLKKHKFLVRYIHFPQYHSSFHGKTVERFLSGEFGNIDQVSPYLSSLAYAVDRASTRKEIEDFLNKGGFVVSDRYVTSSMAHQGSKIKDEKERIRFLSWLYELEYKINKMPKENIVIYLYIPWRVGLKLSEKRHNAKVQKKDIEELDISNWIESEKMYLELAKKYKHWVKIECVSHGNLLSPQQIHRKVIKVLQQKGLI